MSDVVAMEDPVNVEYVTASELSDVVAMEDPVSVEYDIPRDTIVDPVSVE